MRLLLVEDDKLLVEKLINILSEHGYVIDHADNGVDGEYLGMEEPYDAIILDLGLPERPGLEVLANWRKADNRVPVIILTARDNWHERVDGFKAGADDYLGKPFHAEELLERIKALIRRANDTTGLNLSVGGITLDEDTQKATLATGELVELTGTEFRLLRYFMTNPGKVLSKTRLTEHVYDRDSDRDSNVMEVYIRRLRDKLGREKIETRRGQGYIFVSDKQ